MIKKISVAAVLLILQNISTIFHAMKPEDLAARKIQCAYRKHKAKELLEMLRVNPDVRTIKRMLKNPSDMNKVCPICSEEFKESDWKNTRLLSCSHLIHGSCLIHWFKQHDTCPTCRNVTTNQKDYLYIRLARYPLKYIRDKNKKIFRQTLPDGKKIACKGYLIQESKDYIILIHTEFPINLNNLRLIFFTPKQYPPLVVTNPIHATRLIDVLIGKQPFFFAHPNGDCLTIILREELGSHI